MNAFRFRLETLLKLRIALRDERQSELAEAYQAAEILQERRQQLLSELQDMNRQARRVAGVGVVDVDRLASAGRHSLLLQANVRLVENQMAQLASEIERRRQALVEADREVRVLEKLKERQQQHHDEEQLKHEIRYFDDLPRPRNEDSFLGRT